MEQIGSVKVLFIAGFGPIIREGIASRKLYSQILGISFKEENGGYLHTEALKGAQSFALWPLSQAAGVRKDSSLIARRCTNCRSAVTTCLTAPFQSPADDCEIIA
jgi:hypothetical protein